ncbi:MAG: EamA family transporter, partial [Proteobacteria bacterium]|nr:EamA family transporter [Pseudomonadota bacterium]
MFTKNLIRSGWVHALLIAFIIYPLSVMTHKLAASYIGGNILVYTAIFSLTSACALLFIAGPGELIFRTLRRPETWGYGLLQITSYLLFLFSLRYISATEGVALAMMGGLFILVFSFVFLNQELTKYELLGGLMMLSGFYLVIDNTPLTLELKVILSAIVIFRALVICGQKLITEVHKTNRKANNFKSQLRVVGFIMAIASSLFFVFLGSIALIKMNNNIAFLEPFPQFKDFLNLKVWIFAVILGMFVISASKYCEFYAGKTIGARYLTSITSLQIVVIYLLEVILSHFDILKLKVLDRELIMALSLIMLGNVFVALAGFIKNMKFIKKGKIQDTLGNMEHNFVDSQRDFDLVKLNLTSLLSL